MARDAESQAAKVKAGLVDPRDLARRDYELQSIGEHLEANRVHLTAKGSTPKHIALTVNQVRRVLESAGVTKLSGLMADRVQGALKALRDEGLSLGTVNSHRTAVRGFSTWAWKHGRLTTNPLAGVTGFNDREDRRHDRRTLGIDELRLLIETARKCPMWRQMSGTSRALCYQLAIASGLRYCEIQSITPESFDWKAEPPTVAVSAGYTKNGQNATLPLPGDLASDLRSHVATVASGSPGFMLTDDRGATMLRVDLEAAGIAYRDAGDLVYDFHSLRCKLATNADAAGVYPRVVQRLMRHSMLELTGRYTRPRAVDLNQAAESLPLLRPDSDRPHSILLAAMGTNDQPISKDFAAHLPRGGDGLVRKLSDDDAINETTP